MVNKSQLEADQINVVRCNTPAIPTFREGIESKVGKATKAILLLLGVQWL